MNRHLSQKISRLSFLAAALVVIWHGIPVGDVGSSQWWIANILPQGLCRASVPLFFMLFGYLLFRDFPYESLAGVVSWWRRKIFSRIQSLVIPYLFWAFVGIAVSYLLIQMGVKQPVFNWLNWHWWLSAMGISDIPIYMHHLWFVRKLFLFVLIAPLVGFAIRKTGVALIVITFIIALIGSRWRLSISWSASDLFFYFSGCLVAVRYDARCDQKILSSRCAITLLIGWLAAILIKAVMARYGTCSAVAATFHGIYIGLPMNCLGVLALWSIFDYVGIPCVDKIVKSSFFIYCVHWLILPFFDLFDLTGGSRFIFVTCIFLRPILTIIISVVLWLVIRNFTFGKLVLGGRV